MKYIKILSCILFSASLLSCGDDVEETSPSKLGNLEGTIWEMSLVGVSPGNSTITEENYYNQYFLDYADYLGLPYQALGEQDVVSIDTTSIEYNTTYTLTFEKNTCTWGIDELIKRKGQEVTSKYDCYKFTPNDYLVSNERYKDVIDTVRVTSNEVIYCYNKQFEDGHRFLLTLNNGVFMKLMDKSAKDFPMNDEEISKKSIFNNVKVDNTSFIMQNGDEIYSAQYDVTAGWLILNMISPKNEEIGKFKIKKIK